MVIPEKLRALSIRQPFAELILTGDKRIEYRKRLTHIRGRVYVYACKTPGCVHDYARFGVDVKVLAHGMLVGTVEIVDCTRGLTGYEWHLANPQRLETPLRVKGFPQPSFFWPFEE